MEARKSFHQELQELYIEIIRMANSVIELIERTRSAFAGLDEDKARGIMRDDEEIDEYLRTVDANGIELLARQAPVAIDLRTIIVIMRFAQHLERAADNCVNICKAIINLQGYSIPPWIKSSIDEMFEWARRMLERSIEAFKQRDVETADELSKMDDTVDRINRSFLTSFYEESQEEIDLIIRIVMISRFLERIADHAVDIGENIRYMVTGEFIDGI